MKEVLLSCLLIVFCFVVLILLERSNDFIHEVPFICQAPNAAWDIPEFADGCEEACGAMALSWVKGESMIDENTAKHRILSLCSHEEKVFGLFQDTGVDDTANMLYSFWGLDCMVLNYPRTEDLKNLLISSGPVLVPINGTIKGLRSERDDGEGHILMNYALHDMDRHMVLLIGYNDERHKFIVHDPATRNGAYYEFDYVDFVGSICDYPSRGRWLKRPIESINPRVVVVKKGEK